MAYLLDRGFEVHELEDYGYREQISLFADASVVVGPHGAAHTNMLYAQPGMVLVDILGSLVNKCFHNMALTLGHEYWYVFGEDIPSGRAYTDDIFLPLEKLDSIVSLALTGDSGPSESCHPPI